MFTVLVCDDDAAILESLRIYLSQEGYRVLCARDGLEALEQVQGEEIHCMVLDIMMPKADGFEVLRRLRQAGMAENRQTDAAKVNTPWISSSRREKRMSMPGRP